MTKIAIIGGGKIGEALISGLVEGDVEAKNIHVANPGESRSEELAADYGIQPHTDNLEAVEQADIVFLCVKPDVVADVTEEIAETIDNNEDTIVVSLAAGITLSTLEDALPAGTAVVRVMPNTPMLVGKGMSALARGRFVSDEQLDEVTDLLELVGEVAVVKENQMDAVTALAGSAPAYFFLVAEALTDAGVALGIPRDLASTLVSATLEGSGAMLKEGRDPAMLRADVCSPGGTTIAAVRKLEEHGLRAAFYAAAEACAKRSAELGE